MNKKESEWSPCKKIEFRRVLSKTVGIVGSLAAGNQYQLWHNRPDRFIYVDLNAGDGGFPGGWGSPCVAVDVLERERYRTGLKWDMHLFENNADNFGRLTTVFGKLLEAPPKSCLIDMRNSSNIEIQDMYIPDNAYGIVYADPYGGCSYIPILQALSQNDKYSKIDFLINLNAASIKRTNGVFDKCSNCNYGDSFASCLQNINKKFIKIREPDKGQPYSGWQWTMTYLTNSYDLYGSAWKKWRWYDIPESQKRINELAKTKKELAKCKR